MKLVTTILLYHLARILPFLSITLRPFVSKKYPLSLSPKYTYKGSAYTFGTSKCLLTGGILSCGLLLQDNMITDAISKVNIFFIKARYKICIISVIIFLSISNANATIYYVSNTGSDIANGTSTGTPWQTIAKVNSSSFSAGDQILFKKGDSWNERLNPPSSGIVGNVITFSSYGTGNKPIITGFQTLSGWTNNGNIWSSTFLNSAPYQNTVYISGALRAKGRYPNYGYLAFSSHSGKTQITGALTGTPDYTGGEVVIRNNRWTIDHLYITSQSSGTLNFSPAVYYNLTDTYGYFIQNHASVLDTLNEWSYDTTTKVVKVYATSQPTVKASSIDTLVYLSGKSYITFDGIYFEGANMTAINVTSSSHITITNCDIVNSGGNGIDGKLSAFLTVSYCTINNCWNDGIIMIDFNTAYADSDDATFIYNTVSNIGTKSGMGGNRFHTYTGVQIFGDRSVINNNSITNTGYIGLYFYGDTALVKNNYVDTFCYIKDDGAGLYTWMGGGTLKSGGIIRSNIVVNGLSAKAGTAVTDNATYAIYLDNDTKDVLVDSNTVSHIPSGGIFLHLNDSVTVRDNLIYNIEDQPFQIEFGTAVKYIKNIMYSNPSISLMRLRGSNIFTLSDSNYFLNAGDTTKAVYLYAYYNLKRWQDSGYDLHSSRFPSGITAAEPLLKYNKTAASVIYPLTGTYIDANNLSYTGSILLQPYKSSLLFKAITDIVLPPNFDYNPVRKTKIKKINL